MTTVVPNTSSQLADLAMSDFATFCGLMQDDGWFDPKHEEVCKAIQAELESKNVLEALRTNNDDLVTGTVKIMNIWPRGSLKSTIISKLLPAWLSIQGAGGPNIRCLTISNTYDNASKKLDTIRALYDSHITFRALFPHVLPTADSKWTSACAVVQRPNPSLQEGTFEAAGLKTQLTGRHYNLINEDDTIAPEKDDLSPEMSLPSREQIEEAIGWHKISFPLMVPKGVRIRLITLTRWCDEDLADYIEKNEKYLIFDIPAIKSDGSPTFSIFYSNEQLEEIRASIGSYMFSALFLNKPLPAGDRVFKSAWFHYYSRNSVPKDAMCWVSIDPAISEKDTACETGIVKVYHAGSQLYVDNIVHGHFSPHETVIRALDELNKEVANRRCGILIETFAYQKALTYILSDEIRRRKWSIVVEEVNSRTAKEVRIQALQPIYENGQVFHKTGLDPILETQLLQFPNGRLIDVADSFSQHMQVYKGFYLMPEKKEESDHEFERILKEIKTRNHPSILGYDLSRDDSIHGYYVG